MRIINLFRKRTITKKVLILIAIPVDKKGFDEIKKDNVSDFLMNCDWNTYSKTTARIAKFMKEASGLGADVVIANSIEELHNADDYDAVTLFAHHIIDSEEIELNGKRYQLDDVVNAMPESFSGILDLSSCNSTMMQVKLKCRCPECKIIATKVKTSLGLRVVLCGDTLKVMARNHDMSYLDAFKKAVELRLEMVSSSRVIPKNDVIYLGNELHSTVFAPKEVKKGTSFMVQVALHRKSESDEVELMAKMVDDSAEIRNAKSISFKLKKNDKVEMELVSVTDSEFFTIDKGRKSFVWCNEYDIEQFVVSVSPDCDCMAFFGKVKIVVNKKPVGSITFKTNIKDCEVEDSQCADMYFSPYNKSVEMKKQRDFLINQLNNQIEVINKKMNMSDDEKVRQSLNVELDMCNSCMKIINRVPENIYGKLYKVFISSTSDLGDYRMTLKEQIEKNSMHAEMYENWQQSNTYPRDKCCEQVLSSDVLVCLLGERYGYVEPLWGKSMTEIEYRIAEKKGIPICIYVDKNFKNSKDMSQINFVNEISTNRMVTFFEDEMSLAIQSRSELRTVKNELDYGKIIGKQN